MSVEANHLPATLSGEVRQAIVSRLVHAMVESARKGDRAAFDRFFEAAFRLTHGAAWKSAGDAGVAERQTADALLNALHLELDTTARGDERAAPR